MLSSTTRITGTPIAARVVLSVALVLDVLDDRDQDARVALPQENALDVGLRVARDESS